MIRWMLDINACISVINQNPPQVRQRLLRIAPTDVAISEIARYELAYDTLIAAHARSLNVTLVTHNTREFGRVDGLRIENWALDAGEGAQP